MLYLDNICEIKKKNPNSILIVIDANKVSLGWAEAEMYSKASRCSLGTIQVPSSGEKIKWTVRTKGDLKSILSYFEKYERRILVVDGVGKPLNEEVLDRYLGKQKSGNKKRDEVNRAIENGSYRTKSVSNSQRKNYKSSKKKTKKKQGSSAVTASSHVKTRTYKGKTVHNAIPQSVFDLNISGSFKKANPVNTSVGTKDANKRAAEVEKRRQLIDTTIHPNGVRYGDAYRYRKKSRKK